MAFKSPLQILTKQMDIRRNTFLGIFVLTDQTTEF